MAVCNITAVEAQSLAQQLGSDGPWAAICIGQLDWPALLQNASGGLVGRNGQPMNCFNNETWGITYQTCRQYCSFSQMPDSARFNWPNFASVFNSYFLPWIGLTAQLPYQTGGFWSDLMSGTLSIGSPALITFSLGITISNRRWAKHRFDRLYEKARSHPGSNQEWVLHRIESIKFLLEEAQQEPLMINDRDEFRRFIMQEEESPRWDRILKSLSITRRGLTASLFAQNAVAVIAWVLTVVTSFIDNLSSTQIAAGLLWMWLVPVVCGWVAVGTQTRAQAVEEALNEAFESRRQNGAPVAYGCTPSHTAGASHQAYREDGSILRKHDLSVRSDILKKGPLYNYARATTWWKLARTMEKDCSALVDELQGRTLNEKQHRDASRTNAFPPLRKFLEDDPWRLTWSVILALIVQGGICGGAFLVAYQTPPAGLGCNSGSYLIYWIAASLVLVCMIASVLLAHDVEFDRERQRHAASLRTRVLTMLAAFALRTGKLLAVLNCCWLLASTMFELAGLYQTCFCLSSYVALGSNAWVSLWSFDLGTEETVSYWWTVGSCLAAGVWLFFVILFVWFSIEDRWQQWWKRARSARASAVLPTEGVTP